MDENESLRITVLVRGHVQGVGYRAFARRHALDLGLAGYVENLADGRVEIVAEGDKTHLDVLLVKLKMGPAHAEVEDVEVQWGEGGKLRGFFIY